MHSMLIRAKCALTMLVLGALSRAAAADVLVVNASGGGDFVAIQPAIDAASDGDTILVKSGTYAGFAVGGKGVHVVADTGADVVLTDMVFVQNVPAKSRMILSGLRIAPPLADTSNEMEGRGFVAHDNLGALRIFRCEISGASGRPASECRAEAAVDGKTAMHLASSRNVAIGRSTIQGGNGGDHPCSFMNSPGRGAQGLVLANALVAAHATTFRGGDAGDGGDHPMDGGAAAVLHSSVQNVLFASDCHIEGGDGSSPWTAECLFPGDGGAGLVVGSLGTAPMLGSTLLGGEGGTDGNPFCSEPSEDGEPLSGSGDWYVFATTPIGLDAPGVVREGQSIAITVTGAPGDTVHLLDGSDTAFEYLVGSRGYLLVDRDTGSARVRKLGVIPSSGALTRTYHAHELPSGVEAAPHYLQAYRTNGAGVTLGGFVPLVVVDAAF